MRVFLIPLNLFKLKKERGREKLKRAVIASAYYRNLQPAGMLQRKQGQPGPFSCWLARASNVPVW